MRCRGRARTQNSQRYHNGADAGRQAQLQVFAADLRKVSAYGDARRIVAGESYGKTRYVMAKC